MPENSDIKMPPFKDSHIHFTIDGRPAGEDALVEIAESLVKRGILFVYDMGYKSGLGIRAKGFLKERFPMLTIKTSGYAVYKSGSYGVFLGRGISERSEIAATIKEIAALGADFLKLINSGIVSTKGGIHVTPGGFSLEELKIICDTASEANLMVSCHVNGDDAIKNAVLAGISSVEHGFFISQETLHLMKERNVSWTPTIFAFLKYAEHLTGNEKYEADKALDGHLASINYAASIGVKLNVGTDSGAKSIKHGEAFFEELELFKKAGLTQHQILRAVSLSYSLAHEEEP